MSTLTPETLRAQVISSLDRFWFLQSIEEIERTQVTVTFRLQTIRQGLFVQVFWGSRSGTLSFTLVESDRRVFGIDFRRGQWHMHPFDRPEEHVTLVDGLGSNPVEEFLERVEEVIVDGDLL